jgi:hypothetical protein
MRRDRIVLDVKEYFVVNPDHTSIVKDYRYTFLVAGNDVLRIETERGRPEHAHFPPRYSSGTNRHYNIDRWPADLKDMNFLKAFDLWAQLVRSVGQLPEPFRSA